VTDIQPWINQHVGLVIILAFPVLWVTVLIGIGHMTGWAALAEKFRCEGPFGGQQWRWESARMRWWGGYNNCLIVGADPQGLYLSMLLPFRFGHPPLFIPWIEVSVAKHGRWMLTRYVELRLGRECDIPFRVPERLGDRLKVAAGSSWPVEPVP
jgi:hypothetical protein